MIFSKLFSFNKKLKSPVDLSLVGFDMHSHFIPGIDDGARTLTDSLNLIRALQSFGYTKISTSPHIMSDGFRNNPENILGGMEIVNQAIDSNHIPVAFLAAAEYYVDYDFEQKIGAEKLLTFGDNYILIEVSYVNPPDNLDSVIFKLQTSGYKVVLAHPERYPFWGDNMPKYEEFYNKGVILQLNINSLTGYYSAGVKRTAENLIDKGIIQLLGTDCHHEGHIKLMGDAVYQPHLKKLIESGNLINRQFL